jgi:uncharacterized protein
LTNSFPVPKRKLRFRQLIQQFAICRLPANAAAPLWAQSEIFSSITRTADELSIVCPMENVPPECKPGLRWTCFKLEGPFPFSEVGILNSFIDPMVRARIPIFAVSTHDTDYVLVREENAASALQVLKKAGHELISES